MLLVPTSAKGALGVIMASRPACRAVVEVHSRSGLDELAPDGGTGIRLRKKLDEIENAQGEPPNYPIQASGTPPAFSLLEACRCITGTKSKARRTRSRARQSRPSAR